MHTTIDKTLSAKAGILFTCILISFLVVFNRAWANPAQDTQHTSLEAQVEDFVFSQLMHDNQPEQALDVRILVRSVDERISVPKCASPFLFSTNNNPNKQSNVSIKVSCPTSSWYLFMHASVAVIQHVVVSRDNLSPGKLLTARNIEVIEIDKNKLRGSSFSRIDEIIGARIKRRIRAGNIIDGRMLCFVCKGDRVTIAAVSGGLSIKVYGVAEEDGVLGDTIQVRNISSDKLIYGKIASTSKVEISI